MFGAILENYPEKFGDILENYIENGWPGSSEGSYAPLPHLLDQYWPRKVAVVKIENSFP